MPQLGASPAVVIAADRTLSAGQRILHRGNLDTGIEVDLCSVPAERIEVERAGALGSIFDRARQVADPLPVRSDRDHVDDVCDAIIMKVEPGLPPLAEVVCKLGFGFPALRRDQLRIAGILTVLPELRLPPEIQEVDLPDAAPKLEADIPCLRWAPRQRQAALRPEELAGWLVVVDPIER